MIIKQILLAVTLFFVVFVMEITRRIVTGDNTYAFSDVNFLWMLLFASAQSPFFSLSLRKAYKLLALTVGVVAGLLFNSIIGPLLLRVVFDFIKGTPIGSMDVFFGAIYSIKVFSIVISFAVSKAVVRKIVGATASESDRSLAWVWTKIVDIESAKEAAKSGFWAATIASVAIAISATIVLVSQKEFASIALWSYIDAVLYGVVAWRVKKFSRVFTVFGIALCVFGMVVWGTTGWVVVILLLMFINGARGIFAYHRFSAMPVEGERAP